LGQLLAELESGPTGANCSRESHLWLSWIVEQCIRLDVAFVAPCVVCFVGRGDLATWSERRGVMYDDVSVVLELAMSVVTGP
jgi:hypothetical protein